jgi:hypothetical protein
MVNERAPEGTLELELDRLEQVFASVAVDEVERARAATRLQALVRSLSDTENGAGSVATLENALHTASADEIYDFIDKQLGSA